MPMHAFRDRPQTARAMINRVHGCDDREKNLGRANVAGGFVAADVLLAGLEREPITRTTFGIVRDADESTGHVPLVLIAGREVSRVRSAEPERNAKSLGISNGNVGPKFAGRL